MAQVWSYSCRADLPHTEYEKKKSQVYYPYGNDKQSIRSALGKFLPLSKLDDGTAAEGEKYVYAWAMNNNSQAIPPFYCLGTICQLARLPHTKLIEQKKTMTYLLEAYGPEVGGGTMRFYGKQSAFTTWTYRDQSSAMSGIGAPPMVDRDINPDAELKIFRFDPQIMDFESFEGAKTSVAEEMECHLKGMSFDGLQLFSDALFATKAIAGDAYHLINVRETQKHQTVVALS